MNNFSIVFAGTPDFAAAHLQALLDAGIAISAVYSQPDRPAGRGKKLQASPVKQLALDKNIAVYQPDNFKQAHDIQTLAALKPDLLIVVAYGLLLPKAVLDIPRLGCINVHASLLPRWRGAAPIERAIEAGDKETGVTIMQMDVGLDTGNMLSKKTVSITAATTGDSLRTTLADIGGQALIDVVQQLKQTALQGEVQDPTQACYAHKLSKAEAHIDWQQSAQQIAQKIRAFTSSNVCFFLHQGERVKVWQAQAITHRHQQTPGTILAINKQDIVIACAQDALSITELQLSNAKRMRVADVLNGYKHLFSLGHTFE